MSAPVDGDYALDKIRGKDPAREYALASPEDMPRMLFDGGVIERRRPDGPTPVVDFAPDAQEGEPIKVRDLTLVSFTKAQWARRHAASQAEGDRRSQLIKATNQAYERGETTDHVGAGRSLSF